MGQVAPVSGREALRALGRAGFEVLRVKGSHHVLRHADGWTTVVPVHRGEMLGPGLLSKILRDCDLTREAFQALR